jgi:Flp pilus assembly protein TadD
MHDRAQKYYRQALAVQPRDYESLNNLGVSCMLTGDHAAAADAFRRAAALEPRDLAVQNNLGMALAGMEQYDEALEAFRKGGDEQGALNNLAYSYYLNGEFAEAIAHYERALVADGDGKVTILRNLRLAQEAFALEGGAETAPSAGKADEEGQSTVWVSETPPEAEPQNDTQAGRRIRVGPRSRSAGRSPDCGDAGRRIRVDPRIRAPGRRPDGGDAGQRIRIDS